tara:strand:- start:872 stop:1267 length:396 start_codon:yes stop_codon:yes gene_type:complete
MAVPNLVNTTQSYGVTKAKALTTSWLSILGDANNDMTSTGVVPSDYSAKVHSLVISNIDGSNACDVSVILYNASTATNFYLASTISVPADTSLVIISNDSPIWVDEGDTIQCVASANSDLNAVCSFTLFAD